MIFSVFERTVAMRYLRPRGKEGFISVIAGFSLLGIALGVATLIIVMSVMNGFREELLSRILGLNGHIAVLGVGGQLADFDAVAGRVRAVDGVVRVTPIVEGQVMASANNLASGALVRGIRPDDFRTSPLLADSIEAGSLDDFHGRHAVMLGYRLAAALRVNPGDMVTLISPQGSVTAFGSVPRMGSYRVAATFNVGMHEYDSTFVFMPFESAQLFFKVRDAASNLEVMVDDPDRAFAVARAIIEADVGRVHLVTWQQKNASFFNALNVERNVMFLILTLIILVAAFNIISSLIMLVKDKGRDIAILRTMGATRGMIMRIFLMSGASVGVAGTLGGLALGLVFTANIKAIQGWVEAAFGTRVFSPEVYFLTSLPAIIDPAEVAQVVAMGLALSFLATLYPSWRAARLDPVEALRYE